MSVLTLIDAALYSYNGTTNSWENVDGGISKMQVVETPEAYFFQSQSVSSPELPPVAAQIGLDSAYQRQTQTFHCFSVNPSLLLGFNFPSEEIAEQFACTVTTCIENLQTGWKAAPPPPPADESPFADPTSDFELQQQQLLQQQQQQQQKEAEERAAREAQERAAREAQERAAREAQERAAREAQERAAREAQERAAREAQERAAREAQERAAREAQERAAREAEAARARAEQEAEAARARAEQEAEAARTGPPTSAPPKIGPKVPFGGFNPLAPRPSPLNTTNKVAAPPVAVSGPPVSGGPPTSVPSGSLKKMPPKLPSSGPPVAPSQSPAPSTNPLAQSSPGSGVKRVGVPVGVGAGPGSFKLPMAGARPTGPKNDGPLSPNSSQPQQAQQAKPTPPQQPPSALLTGEVTLQKLAEEVILIRNTQASIQEQVSSLHDMMKAIMEDLATIRQFDAK